MQTHIIMWMSCTSKSLCYQKIYQTDLITSWGTKVNETTKIKFNDYLKQQNLMNGIPVDEALTKIRWN